MHGHAIHWYDVATYVGFCAMPLLTSLDVRRAATGRGRYTLRAEIWGCAGAALVLASRVTGDLAGTQAHPGGLTRAAAVVAGAGLTAVIVGASLKAREWKAQERKARERAAGTA